MILKNLANQQSLTLHHDLMWIDEHAWNPVVSATEYTLSGALVVEYATKQTGRPISLQAPDQTMAWLPRSTVDTLRTWSTVPGTLFELSLDDGRKFNVVFRHHEQPVLEASPVRDMATYDADDDWQVKLKFMEI